MTKEWNQTPSTSNPEAAALIRQAQAKCAGCRVSWRMDKRKSLTTHYRTVSGKSEPWLQCAAQEERRALREIVAGTRHTFTVTIRAFDRQSRSIA